MNDIDREKLYRDMAARYAEDYGARLKRELDELDAQNARLSSPRFDERVRKSVRARRRRPALWAAAAAACVLLLVLLPIVLTPASRSPAPEPKQDYEVIPLGFELPDGFSVTNVAQDIEKTVYYLTDSNLEGVVMTLEEASGQMPNEGLEEMEIGQKRAYGLVAEDYSILTLEDGGILYTMTCKRDMDSLLELGRSI